MYTCGIITISDKGFNGLRVDETGPKLANFLKENGYLIKYETIIPDEFESIQKELLHTSDNLQLNLIITNGGTGFSLRDITPEATTPLLQKVIPGFSEYMRQRSLEITPKAILSRGVSGIRNKSIIINLPGSPKGALENLSYIIDTIPHGIDTLTGKSKDCAKANMP